VSPVKYELEFYIPEDGILHSHRRENLESYIVLLSGRYSYPICERVCAVRCAAVQVVCEEIR
jgi:hypothetical protein